MNTHRLSLHKAHFLLIILAICMLVSTSYAWEKTPDRAMDKYYDVVREAAPGLPGWTVYRPDDQALIWNTRTKLPVVVWSNGACTITNDSYVYFLMQVAAHGFVVVAFGEPGEHTNPNGIAEADRMKTAIDWATATPWHGGPWYFNQLDKKKIATAGHSCGGVDAEYTAVTDPRVKTTLVLNSGFQPDGRCGMSGPLACSRALIPNLYGPGLFVNGGATDVAYQNSIDNYTLNTVKPAALVSHASAGHSGFYGTVSRTVQLQLVQTVVEWLDGILNKNTAALQWVIGPDGLSILPDWTVQSKGF
jgi:hypothetical protein